MLGRWTFPYSYNEYRAHVANILATKDIDIYVDTNILAFAYKAHQEARKELFQWFGELKADDRLWLPAWCATEYFQRVSTKTLSDFVPMNVPVDSLANELEKHLGRAKIFVEDSTTLAPLENALNELKKCQTKGLLPKKTHDILGQIHEEVVALFEDLVLPSNLSEVTRTASEQGPWRYQERIPPGWADAAKTKNRNGDLILWLEILEHCKSRSQTRAILITNDEKSDWTYAPEKRSPGASQRGYVPNTSPTLRITDPRLVREFRQMFSGSQGAVQAQFEVISIFDVISAMSEHAPSGFGKLAAALQLLAGDDSFSRVEVDAVEAATGADNESFGQQNRVESAEGDSGSDSTTQPGLSPSGNTSGVQTGEQGHGELQMTDRLLAITVSTSAEADGSLDASRYGQPLQEIIANLKSRNWYIQNPAVKAFIARQPQLSDQEAYFVVGRNIYQAACGNALEAVEFVTSFDVRTRELSTDFRDYVLAGMVFEVHFDRAGHHRGTATKGRYWQQLETILNSGQYPRVKTYIEAKLESVRKEPASSGLSSLDDNDG